MTTQLFLLPALYFLTTDADRIVLRAEPAPASVAVQAEGRRLLQLPDLEYRLSIEKHCGGGRRAESVSLTVADTRQTLRGELLPSDPEIETSLRIAAAQLAPLAVNSFCVAVGDAGSTLLVPSVLTVQASLRCTGEESESIVYASEPLDVAIRCEPDTVQATP